MDSPRIANKPRLLVVDDEPGVCLALFFLLQEHYEVVTAESAQDALGQLPGDFSLILLDFCLPGVAGCDLLDRVRALAPRTPVAILSASSDHRTREEVVRHGARMLIEKPFARRELLARIEEMLSTASSGYTLANS